MQQRQRASAVSDVIASQAERQRKRNESSRTMKMKSKKEMVTKITSRTVSTFQTQSQRRLRLQQKQMHRPTLRRGVPTNTSTTTTTSSSTSVVSKSVKRQNVERLRERVSNLLTSVLPSRVANDSSYYDKVFRIAYGISIVFLKEEPGGLSGAIMSDEQIATAARHSHYAVKAVVPLYHRFLSDDDDDENEDDEEEDDEIMDSLSSSLGGSRTWCSSAKRENIYFLIHLLRVLTRKLLTLTRVTFSYPLFAIVIPLEYYEILNSRFALEHRYRSQWWYRKWWYRKWWYRKWWYWKWWKYEFRYATCG